MRFAVINWFWKSRKKSLSVWVFRKKILSGFDFFVGCIWMCLNPFFFQDGLWPWDHWAQKRGLGQSWNVERGDGGQLYKKFHWGLHQHPGHAYEQDFGCNNHRGTKSNLLTKETHYNLCFALISSSGPTHRPKILPTPSIKELNKYVPIDRVLQFINAFGDWLRSVKWFGIIHSDQLPDKIIFPRLQLQTIFHVISLVHDLLMRHRFWKIYNFFELCCWSSNSILVSTLGTH